MQPYIKWLPLLLIFFHFTAQSLEIESSGYGETIQKSIENAKNNAIANYNGEILVSKKEYANNALKEEIYSYQTGVIESFKILSGTCSDICKSVINAIVVGKVDLKIQTIDGVNIPKFHQFDEDIIRYLKDVGNIFVIKTKSITYSEVGAFIKVDTKNTIELNSLWLETLKKYVELTSSKTMLAVIDGKPYDVDLSGIIEPSIAMGYVNIYFCYITSEDQCKYKGRKAYPLSSKAIIDFDPYHPKGYFFKKSGPAFLINSQVVEFEYSTLSTKDVLNSSKQILITTKPL
jgi:hypothetical protein